MPVVPPDRRSRVRRRLKRGPRGVTAAGAASYLRGMRALACVAAVIASALATSGCASSNAAHSEASTAAVQLHEIGYNQLSRPLQHFIRSTLATGPHAGPVTEIEIYGPASRAALVEASSGDMVVGSPRQRKQAFYLIVFHGQFVCGSCHGPAGSRAPQGTIETRVWSPTAGVADFGIGNSLPAAVSLLNPLAVIQVS